MRCFLDYILQGQDTLCVNSSVLNRQQSIELPQESVLYTLHHRNMCVYNARLQMQGLWTHLFWHEHFWPRKLYFPPFFSPFSSCLIKLYFCIHWTFTFCSVMRGLKLDRQMEHLLNPLDYLTESMESVCKWGGKTWNVTGHLSVPIKCVTAILARKLHCEASSRCRSTVSHKSPWCLNSWPKPVESKMNLFHQDKPSILFACYVPFLKNVMQVWLKQDSCKSL